MFQKKTVLRENNVNIEIKSLDITVQLYIFYEHETPISCKTTVYLLWLIQSEDVLGGEVYTGEHENLWSSQCQETQGDQ